MEVSFWVARQILFSVILVKSRLTPLEAISTATSCRIHFLLSFLPSFLFFFFFLSLFILLSSLNLVHHLVFKMVYSWVYLGTKQLSDLPQGYTAEQVLERNSKTVSFVINSQLFTTTTRPYHLPQGMHKAQ